MNYFILNPISGSNNLSLRNTLISLIESNTENVILETATQKHAVELTQKAIAAGAKKIIAIGGDGTINEVASVLTNTEIPLGIIPLGSGNGLARHLKIPMQVEKAYQVALNGNPIRIDVGSINGKRFFCTAGIGFDATVANAFAKGEKRGLFNYITATLSSLIKYKPIQVSINQGPLEEVFSLTIANANQFGNNAYISPFSNIQDGTLEIVKIKKMNWLQASIVSMRLFFKLIHNSPLVEIIKTKEIKIAYKSNANLHMDGEALKTTEPVLTISIEASALNVIV